MNLCLGLFADTVDANGVAGMGTDVLIICYHKLNSRWSQCACKISAVEQRVYIGNASSKYVSWKKCKGYHSSIVACKRTEYGIVICFKITNSFLHRIKIRRLCFLVKACFTLGRNMNNESNILVL